MEKARTLSPTDSLSDSCTGPLQVPVAPGKTRILVSESNGFSTEAADLLNGVGEVVLADLDRDGLLKAVREVDVLWVRLRHRIDAEVMTAGLQLKAIVTPTTGLNHVDLEQAAHRGILVLSLQGETSFLADIRATAEHTLALMLALLRHVPEAAAHVRAGRWNRDLFKGRELYGKTVGIIGYGRLGRIVGRYVKAFDARVLAADPHVGAVEQSVTLVSLADLLREADLVTIHVDLRDETRRFFGAKELAAMKRGAWLVNTSRGELLDEDALLDALHSGHLAGAALDVLGHEDAAGMPAHPLVVCARDHDHLLITPHIGGCTSESMAKTEVFLARKLRTLIAAAGKDDDAD